MKNGNSKYPGSFSPKGDYLAYVEVDPVRGADIWILPMTGDRKPQSFIDDQYNERMPRFSPDGRWLAYSSNKMGQDEVYIVDFPGKKIFRKISADGGTAPVWADKSGRELFYSKGNKLMAVSIDLQSGIPGATSFLFENNCLISDRPAPGFDVADDGQRFLVRLLPGKADEPVQINLVTNWFEELKRLCPLGKK